MEKRISILTQENDILLENFTKLKEKYHENERTLKQRIYKDDELYE